MAQSNIYPGSRAMFHLLTLSHFPFEPGCKDYFFLGQVVKDFEQGLDSILIDSIDMPEFDKSFDEADAMLSSVF